MMEIKGMIYCLFEQSGTFKREFKSLGYTAYDYDIQNEFGETDYVIDLFKEIERGFYGISSIFDSMNPDDLIMAFFPCIFFCEENTRLFLFDDYSYRCCTHREAVEKMIMREKNRARFFELAIMLFSLCEDRGLRLIVENPYSTQHYLRQYFPYRPAVIDYDRSRRGDNFKKPTQYWFINCAPTDGHSYSPVVSKSIKSVSDTRNRRKVDEYRKRGIFISVTGRSAISSKYAHNFICDFILGKESKYNIQPYLF